MRFAAHHCQRPLSTRRFRVASTSGSLARLLEIAASDSGVVGAAVNSAPLSEPPFVATSSVSASSRTRLMVSLALGLMLALAALGAAFAFRVIPRTGDVVVAVTG